MIIEKRHELRVNTWFGGEILHRSRSFSATIKNLSAGGMLLATGPLNIPRGNMVEIRFWFQEREWQLPGLVVQLRQDGLSIMFRERQTALFEQVAIGPLQGPPVCRPLPLPQAGRV